MNRMDIIEILSKGDTLTKDIIDIISSREPDRNVYNIRISLSSRLKEMMEDGLVDYRIAENKNKCWFLTDEAKKRFNINLP